MTNSTLADRLCVVVVLAILAAVVLPSPQAAGDGSVAVDVSFDAPAREGVTIDLLYYRAATSPDDEGATEPRLFCEHWEDAVLRRTISLPYSIGQRSGWLRPYMVSHRPNRIVALFRGRAGEELARTEQPFPLAEGLHRIVITTPESVSGH